MVFAQNGHHDFEYTTTFDALTVDWIWATRSSADAEMEEDAARDGCLAARSTVGGMTAEEEARLRRSAGIGAAPRRNADTPACSSSTLEMTRSMAHKPDPKVSDRSGDGPPSLPLLCPENAHEREGREQGEREL